jgi:hemolysin D
MQERLDIRKTLYDHSTGSKAGYLELLQPLVEEQHELKVQKSKISEADSAIAAIIEERPHTDAEYRRQHLRVCPDTLGRITKFSKHEPNCKC